MEKIFFQKKTFKYYELTFHNFIKSLSNPIRFDTILRLKEIKDISIEKWLLYLAIYLIENRSKYNNS